MPDVLEVEALSHAYGNVPVLDRVSLRIGEGELVSVLGRSGAGKTTLLRAIGGFLTPSAGRITVGGKDFFRDGRILVAPERRGLGIVFQDYALFSHMTVTENVAFGLSRKERHGSRVSELLAAVGLSEHADKLPSALSGGQQQRVALARAIAPKPPLLLLDEPFANLDAALRTELERELRTILAATGTAALMITHDRREALSIADRVAIMEAADTGGAITQLAAPQTVYTEPATPEAARLTGDCAIVHASCTENVAHTPFGEVPSRSSIAGDALLLIRPESFAITARSTGPARVVGRSFQGAEIRYRVAQGGAEIDVTAPSSQFLDIGAQVLLTPSAPFHAWPKA